MPAQNGTKRQRHVPVKNATHVYKSQRATGKWVYEVRHPANAKGERLYEVVGQQLPAAKARAREVHGGTAPRVVSVGTTIAEVFADWKAAREMRPRSAETFDAVYRLHIEPRFGRKKVREIDKREIQTWLNGLRRRDGRDGELAT